MGELTPAPLLLDFDARLRLEFRGATITSDAGLLVLRELDDALGLTRRATDFLSDARTGLNISHHFGALLRQSLFSRIAGYDDFNDADRLASDPSLRLVTGRLDPKRSAASSRTLGRFEADVLAREENLSGLSRLNASWIERVLELTPHKRVILDLDSSVSPVHGAQEGSAYNGHFQTTCFHPLFLFNQWGDCEGATLRPGNVSSAEDWKQVLAPAVERHLARATRVLFRGDAAFAKPELYDYLEENGIEYAIRLPANDVLHARIEHLLTRPVGRPPKKPVVDYESFRYGAGTWDKERRVVAKVEWHAGELFPRLGFVVTNRQHLPSKGVIHFYNGRGTCEQWIKEGKHALNWTRLSCHRFAANRARFGLFVLAYNLANFFRRLALPKETESWSLQTIKVRLVKTGARLVRHARQLTMQIAEAAVPRRLWLGMLRRIGELRSG